MRDALQHAANQIISGTVGQVIDKAGYTSIGTGLGLKVAEQTPVAQSYIASMIPHSITEWAAVASILGALSLVAKNLFEMWWKIRESKKNGSTDSKCTRRRHGVKRRNYHHGRRNGNPVPGGEHHRVP